MSASDASLVSFLQSELLVLSSEIKKKHPNIKESIESVFQLIRKIKDDPDRPNAAEVFSQTELILQPIVLSCRTGNSRVIAIAINCLQKLVIFQAFPRECIGSVFVMLDASVDLNADIQLKALQCLPPLLTNYSDICGAELLKLFSIAFRLHESKTGMVTNAAAAIIRQMMISLLERITVEGNHDHEHDYDVIPPVHVQDALAILTDISGRLDDEKPVFLDLTRIDKPFALDLIESVLANHAATIRGQPAFVALIRDRICPAIIASFKNVNGKMDFARSCRMWRIVQVIVADFHDLFADEVEIFVSLFVRILRESPLAWERAMVLEVVKGIFVSPSLMEEVYLICEDETRHPGANPRVFSDLMETVLEVIEDVLQRTLQPAATSTSTATAMSIGMPANVLSDASIKISYLNQFDKAAPPTVAPMYLLLLGYEAYCGWMANGASLLRGVAMGRGAGVGDGDGDGEWWMYVASVSPDATASVRIVHGLVQSVAPHMNHVVLRVFSELCFNQAALHAVTIELFSRMLTVYAVLGLHRELFEFVDVLRSVAVPEALCVDPFLGAAATGVVFTTSSLLVMRMMLETTQTVGELLEESWLPLMHVFHAVDQLQGMRLRRQQLPGPGAAGNGIVQIGDEDVAGQTIALNGRLMELSPRLSNAAFAACVQAACQLADAGLRSSVERVGHAGTTGVLSPLLRLRQLIALNMHRFGEEEDECTPPAWDVLMEELNRALQVADPAIRQTAGETLSLAVDLFGRACPASRMKQASAATGLQLRVLGPLARVTRTVRWPDVHRTVLECLLRHLQGFGEALSEASWLLAWEILQETLVRLEELLDPARTSALAVELATDELWLGSGGAVGAAAVLYRGIHEVIKMACADLLRVIPGAVLGVFIDLVAAFGRGGPSTELNIPLNTVRYLWDISDYVCAHRATFGASDVFFALWLRVLRHLVRLSVDPRPELRNSAVQTLLRTISMNGATVERTGGEWTRVFEDVLQPFFADLRGAAMAASPSRATNPVTMTAVDGMSPPQSPLLPLAHDPPLDGTPISHPSSPIGFAHYSRDSVGKQWDETEGAAMTGVGALLQMHFSLLTRQLAAFPRHWHGFLAVLRERALLSTGSVELTGTAVNVLAMLAAISTDTPRSDCDGDHQVDLYWRPLWETWCEIGEGGMMSAAGTFTPSTPGGSPFFTQDSLLRFLRIFPGLMVAAGDGGRDAGWLRRSLRVVTATLQCATPTDVVRDVETPSELQRFLLTGLLSPLIASLSAESESESGMGAERETTPLGGNGQLGACRALVLREMTEWLSFVQEASNGAVVMLWEGGGGRSRQSTAASASSCRDDDGGNWPGPLLMLNGRSSSTFIAATSVLLERLSETFSRWQSCEYLYRNDGEDATGSEYSHAMGSEDSHAAGSEDSHVTGSEYSHAAGSEYLHRDGKDTTSTVAMLIAGCGRFMRLKYRCPHNSRNEPLWKTATGAFVTIVRDALSSRQSLAAVWPVLVDELEAVLLTAKHMFLRGQTEERSEGDERFDCQLLDLLRDCVIPRLIPHDDGGVLLERTVKMISQLADVTEESERVRGKESFPRVSRETVHLPSHLPSHFPSHSHSPTAFMYPSGTMLLHAGMVKEVLASGAHRLLFHLASHEYAMRIESAMATTVTMPHLLMRCQRRLDAFIVDCTVLGAFPLSRLRENELLLLCHQLLTLNSDGDGCQLNPSSSSPSVDRPHLRALYTQIVQCVALDASEFARRIARCCQQMLMLMGESMGVVMSHAICDGDDDDPGCVREQLRGLETEMERKMMVSS